MADRIQSRVWKFGDGINSDLILPGHAISRPIPDQRKYVFEANRPGWAAQVQPGDVIVAGFDFGVGSGRPTPRVLKDAGISVILAESFNGLFLRQCVNFGLPIMQCAGVRALFEEMDPVEVDFDAWCAVNRRTGRRVEANTLPEMLKRTMLTGGVVPFLISQGYIREAVPLRPA
ncbi:MAG: 3-isopropylmalate dehydratase [Burkholderiales bacterium]|nr:3-isopropylmalate dehydratase [Burkholderiales bacterium]